MRIEHQTWDWKTQTKVNSPSKLGIQPLFLWGSEDPNWQKGWFDHQTWSTYRLDLTMKYGDFMIYPSKKVIWPWFDHEQIVISTPTEGLEITRHCAMRWQAATNGLLERCRKAEQEVDVPSGGTFRRCFTWPFRQRLVDIVDICWYRRYMLIWIIHTMGYSYGMNKSNIIIWNV